jgi:hypothetical protein
MALIFYSFHFLGEFACVLPDLLGGKGSRVGSTKGRKAIKGLPFAFFLFLFRVFSLRHFKWKQSHRFPLLAEGIIYFFLAYWDFMSCIFYKYLSVSQSESNFGQRTDNLKVDSSV